MFKDSSLTGKRLAKNTAFMYFRMIVLLIINLYASRVVIRQLGISDYGIYNVVGSIVLMFSSLKAMFASSTQRFLNYEMGRKNIKTLREIYNTSAIINVIIAVGFAIIVEIIGIWFLECKANIDSDRIVAAHWVLQFSIISTVISISSTPLDACVLAHERMDFYAYLSLFEGFAKLIVCYLLAFAPIDKLVFYGFLILVISVVVRIVNQIFCNVNFVECKLQFVWNKGLIKEMTVFAGWSFFGNTAYIISQNGLNLILNIFGGSVVNAARGIAYQVNGALRQFVINIAVVVKPQAIKAYASNDIQQALRLSYMSSKIFFFVQLLICLCFTIFTREIINLWLGHVPDFTETFVNLILFQSLIQAFMSPIDMLFAAEGDIKLYQIAEGILLFLPVPIAYVALSLGYPYESAFIGAIICDALNILAISYIASKKCHLELGFYYKTVLLPCTLCAILYLLIFYATNRPECQPLHKVLICATGLVAETLLMWKWVLTTREKEMLKEVIRKKGK